MISTRTYLILLVAGLAFIPVSYHYIDVPVAWWSFSQGADFSFYCQVLSLFGDSSWYIAGTVVGWLTYTYYRPDPYRASRYAFVLASVAGSGIVAGLIKFIFGRERPIGLAFGHDPGFHWFEFQTRFVSFPSGHTTTAFALFMTMSILFPRFRLLWLAFAFLMAFARIGVPDHYVSDTVAGALLGMGFTLFLARRYPKTFFKEAT